jgi:hypothetical protein
VRPVLFQSKNALLAVAGAVVVLIGMLFFAVRHKEVPPPPPVARVSASGTNPEAPGGTANQNQYVIGTERTPPGAGAAGTNKPEGAPGTTSQNQNPVGTDQEIADLTALRSSIAANQASAVLSLRTLNEAATGYWLVYKRYPASLSVLGRPLAGTPPLIDEELASGKKSGYVFTYSAGEKDVAGVPYEIYVDPDTGLQAARPASPARVDAYTIHADPLTPGTTGQNHYFTDQTGVIRQERDRPANEQSSPVTG